MHVKQINLRVLICAFRWRAVTFFKVNVTNTGEVEIPFILEIATRTHRDGFEETSGIEHVWSALCLLVDNKVRVLDHTNIRIRSDFHFVHTFRIP
jgi:hypothetical protein